MRETDGRKLKHDVLELKFYYLSHIEELPFNHINRYKERAVAV
jgi:hypothetical protein